MSDDLVKRLREHVTDIFNFRGNVMTAWDMVRSMIAKGDKSSGPRDIIESYLAAYAEDMKEAADRIEKLEAALKTLIHHCEDGYSSFSDIRDTAREALEGKDDR